MIKIKNIIKTTFVFIFILSIMVFLAYSETHYSRVGVVKHNNGSIYTFKDNKGNNWAFNTNEIIPANAKVKLKFFTNNTMDNIYDDMIVDYKIIGYIDEIDIDI